MRLTDQLGDDIDRIQIILWRKRSTGERYIDELVRLREDADTALAELSRIPDVQPVQEIIEGIGHELEEFKRLTGAAITIEEQAEAQPLLDKLLTASGRIHALIDDLGAYTAGYRDEELDEAYQQTRSFLALVMGALADLLVLSAGVTVNVVRGIRQPVARLMEANGELSRRNFRYRADENLLDEFGDLARSFNRMADELSRGRATAPGSHSPTRGHRRPRGSQRPGSHRGRGRTGAIAATGQHGVRMRYSDAETGA